MIRRKQKRRFYLRRVAVKGTRWATYFEVISGWQGALSELAGNFSGVGALHSCSCCWWWWCYLHIPFRHFRQLCDDSEPIVGASLCWRPRIERSRAADRHEPGSVATPSGERPSISVECRSWSCFTTTPVWYHFFLNVSVWFWAICFQETAGLNILRFHSTSRRF